MHDAFSTSNPYNITIELEVKYIAENALLIRKNKELVKILESNKHYEIKEGTIVS